MIKLIAAFTRWLTGTNPVAITPATAAPRVKPATALARVPKSLAPAPEHRTVVVQEVSKPTAHQADRIGIVGFHSKGFVIAKPAQPLAPWLLERSQRLHERIGGTTNITAGLQQALALLQVVPRGMYRKIWLLSDGAPNEDTVQLFPTVRACCEAHININTIGFGDQFDAELLQRIASATHNGRFVSVGSLRELTRALVDSDISPGHGALRRREVTILAIDLSASMKEPMEGRTKIAVVEEAIRHLIHYKQKVFS